MRAMLGLLEPTYGEIEVMGVDVREQPKDVCRIVGFMPDFPPVYEDLMVWEFLDLFAASYGLDRSQRRHAVADHLDMVGTDREARGHGRRAVARHAPADDARQDA